MATPKLQSPDDQGWLWTPEWQPREREADEAMARRGRGRVFEAGEEFFKFLDAKVSAAY